ncbi:MULTISPECIES: CbiX/SirB N-terminal domain-containing protein [Aphanothece]|uniref:CbiX/SirB N-terminal domain-containing protein n=1 Tax=Aphanothece TaxID=1121 RepID=UPI00398E793F
MPLEPTSLPETGTVERWPWLQQLRRSRDVPLEPWLEAIETGRIRLEQDLLAALAERLTVPAVRRLLRCWLANEKAEPALLAVLGRFRDPDCAGQIRQALQGAGPERMALLLPLLGYQRDPADFALLRGSVLAPQPSPTRRAALEGLAVGLPAWPPQALRDLLRQLAFDLDTRLAGTAVDLLARLPQPRLALARLAPERLDPGLDQRRRRRLAAIPAHPLVLVVHGRGGGLIPAEVRALAGELERRRRSPVVLQALTAQGPETDPLQTRQAAPGEPVTLVPLLLLPGGHVCRDLPLVKAHWRASGPVHHLPFLGSWPAWQQALRRELVALRGPVTLLHHPLNGPLAARYLRHLEQVCNATCLATPYSAADSGELSSVLADPAQRPVLPLVLASNRLTEGLPAWCGTPLLQRAGLRDALLEMLAALP